MDVLTYRILRLEEVIRAQTEYLKELTERIGETFTKQAYTVKDLMLRWNCSESYVRKIVSSHKLKLLRGANGQPRSPIAVLRSSILEYENGNTLLKFPKRRTKPVPTWEDYPYYPNPKVRPIEGSRTRRLGEPL